MKEKNNDKNLEIYKETFHTWGTYQSLEKDAKIVCYFYHEYDKNFNKYIRQKTIIDHFKHLMSPKTCREHIYKLLEKGILVNHPGFSGMYRLNDDLTRELWIACDRLIYAVMGEEIYKLASKRWKGMYRT